MSQIVIRARSAILVMAFFAVAATLVCSANAAPQTRAQDRHKDAAQDGAQDGVVLLVSGQPVTALDIQQRSKFMEMSSHKVPPRQEVIDSLVDEILELREAKRYTVDPTDNDVNEAFNSVASNMGVDSAKLSQMLEAAVPVPEPLSCG
jgi:hypothetical protein